MMPPQSGSFTERVEIYLIQCDAEVQSVERLTSLDRVAAHGMDGWGCALGLMGPAFGNGRPGPE